MCIGTSVPNGSVKVAVTDASVSCGLASAKRVSKNPLWTPSAKYLTNGGGGRRRRRTRLLLVLVRVRARQATRLPVLVANGHRDGTRGAGRRDGLDLRGRSCGDHALDAVEQDRRAAREALARHRDDGAAGDGPGRRQDTGQDGSR